ncbi:putative DUF1640 domain-containing protein [Azospirillaceae bacterium]
MGIVAFDTMKFVRTLRTEANMDQKQAEGVVMALTEAMGNSELATKSDIQAVKAEIQTIEKVLSEKIDRKSAESDSKMVKWVVGSIVTAILTLGGMIGGSLFVIIRIVSTMH